MQKEDPQYFVTVQGREFLQSEDIRYWCHLQQYWTDKVQWLAEVRSWRWKARIYARHRILVSHYNLAAENAKFSLLKGIDCDQPF